MPVKWKGYIEGEPAEISRAEVRRRYGLSYGSMWYIDRDGVRLACDAEAARLPVRNRDKVVLKKAWPDVAELFKMSELVRRHRSTDPGFTAS